MTPREFLYSLERFGIKLGLDNIRALLAKLGQPHERYPSVHVAGTNGKGSVVAMLDAILCAAGLHTGRYTSPHLIDLNERFLHERAPIPDAELDAVLARLQHIAEAMAPPPTFFEMATAAAFAWFAQRDVDAALVETGMGGRYDATNVVVPMVAVITNISLEHTRYLGTTVEKIAYEKAGILKQSIPFVLGERAPGPSKVILDIADGLAATPWILGRDFTYTIEGTGWDTRFTYQSENLSLKDIRLGLPGSYQGENAALAVATAEILQARWSALTDEVIEQGLRDARWPCRLEQVLDSPRVVIDVAHNAAGAQRLAEEMPRCVAIVAVSSDKDGSAILRAAEDMPHETALDLPRAIEAGLRQAREMNLPVLVTGSIFAAGEARDYLIRHHGAAPLKF
ncbi:MAG: bifunctional folylpolyglutamate synthase/dihydrofolate synthase [Candidatus Hydrogenedentes bacterium]|nr:bifunctional folylpolyglutamate synthase/dihydrofolate synthase [Candidatus Hydrogenedentota bacterium]